MASFSRNITEFVQKTRINLNLVVRKIAMDALRGVILKSPVDTGRFRASWRVGINAPDLSVESAGTVASGALETKGQVATAKKALKVARGFQLGGADTLLDHARFGDAIYITNNLPYAKRLEDGWSMQAPHGMVRNTVEEIVAGFDEAVKSLGGAA